MGDQRYACRDRRALARLGLHRERARDAFRAGAHAVEAEPAGAGAFADGERVEALAVVADVDDHLVAEEGQGDADP
jgi:hypothetical protein